MRYVKTVNVWKNPTAVRNLQPGQWVSAGSPEKDRSNCGQFYGITASGTVVVAWNGNARRNNWRSYHRATQDFAKGSRIAPK
jgi:hypothetical protein